MNQLTKKIIADESTSDTHLIWTWVAAVVALIPLILVIVYLYRRWRGPYKRKGKQTADEKIELRPVPNV